MQNKKKKNTKLKGEKSSSATVVVAASSFNWNYLNTKKEVKKKLKINKFFHPLFFFIN